MATVSRGWQQQRQDRPALHRTVQPVTASVHPRQDRLSRDTLAAMETQPLRDALRRVDQQIVNDQPPRGWTLHDCEVEWCYIRRELEFRGGRREQ